MSHLDTYLDTVILDVPEWDEFDYAGHGDSRHIIVHDRDDDDEPRVRLGFTAPQPTFEDADALRSTAADAILDRGGDALVELGDDIEFYLEDGDNVPVVYLTVANVDVEVESFADVLARPGVAAWRAAAEAVIDV